MEDPVPDHPDRVLEPDRRLGPGWQDSPDRAVATSGDETGLHVLVADRSEAYQWRTVATLAEPGLPSDQWIGQLCVSGSGDRAVVVYAPREFTNEPAAMAGGGYAALVNLDTGEVDKLGQRVTLAYYNPSCGADGRAVVSRLEPPGRAGMPARTWIGIVDVPAGEIVSEVTTAGQVTSATPVGGRILAAKGNALVEVTLDGALTTVAETQGAPFRLIPDGRDGLAFQVARGEETDLAQFRRGRFRAIDTVPLGTVKLRPGAGGDVYALGGRATERLGGRAPSRWRVLDALPDSQPSTGGRLLVTRAATGVEAAGRLGGSPGDGRAQAVGISVALLEGGRTTDEVSFTVSPAGGKQGRELSPALGSPAPRRPDAPRTTADYSTVPWDPDRACAVPRNHPEIQVYQPSPEQVEWAANLAVRGQLTFQRPADWLDNGLPAYSPQGYFPSKPLLGGGHVPAQVLLGVLAQESNLWQASFHVVDALAGNPLTSSGFYGIHWNNQDPDTIDWSKVDCGYGAAQVTTGMHTDDTGELVNGVVMDYNKQKAVVLDYATNIAAGLRILQDKWNQTRSAGLVANNGDPQYIENWWFALWAYNSGFYPDQGDGQPWGVGWSNNPASPEYPPDRQMFLTEPLDVPEDDIDDEVGYDNAKHPNHWSYPERVVGFAYTSLIRWDYTSQSWKNTYTSADRDMYTHRAQPDRLTFCDPAVNQCDPEQLATPGLYPTYPETHCLRDDLKCWWNQPVNWLPPLWVECNICGTEKRIYTSVEPRPLASSIYDSQCSTAGLPAGARVIDDIDSATPLGPQGCWRNWTVGGRFELEFEPSSGVGGATVYPGKVDTHQVGGGFGGHFWFTHTLQESGNEQLRVTGRWRVDPVDSWARVLVHIPDHGAHTRQARYEITLPDGRSKHRVIPTNYEAHNWVSIGAFDFRGSTGATVELSNFTRDGGHNEDVAWDAIAVQPLPKKPDHFVVAMGDSYSSGEGAGIYTHVSNQYGDDSFRRNACRRGSHAWPRQIQLAGAPARLGTLADQLHSGLDYHTIACSGARTYNVLTFGSQNAFGKEAVGQYHELPQLEQGFLDENTTLVTLTIGGNDARWSTVVRGCALNINGCDDDDFILTGTHDGEDFVDPAPLNVHEPWLMRNLVVPSVTQVVAQIRAAAPNAHIQLLGYPELVEPTVGCIDLLGSGEVAFLNDLAVLFAGTYAQLSSWPNVDVVDTIPGFRGHRICAADSWLNGMDFTPNGGADTRGPLSMESFHPKAVGYAHEGQWVSDQLTTLGYTW